MNSPCEICGEAEGHLATCPLSRSFADNVRRLADAVRALIRAFELALEEANKRLEAWAERSHADRELRRQRRRRRR